MSYGRQIANELMDAMLPKSQPTSRYEIITKIAAGGMATVYLGALRGPFGFEQLVAVKRLHAHLLDEPAVRESLLMEARSASRIRHANVVDVRDVEVFDDSVQLVMTYIEGASLSTLLINATRNKTKVPIGVAIRIVLDACAGLHAAHELADSNGKPVGLVHRDVSLQNVLVGVDGIARITDFGIARDESSQRILTRTGALKGKFPYMAPEYIRGRRTDRRVDVFALAVVLWEALAGRRLFKGSNDADTVSRVTEVEAPRIARQVPELGDDIDSFFEMALSKNPETRFATAQALGLALETIALKANVVATAGEVGQYVREHARVELERLEQLQQAAARNNEVNDRQAASQGVATVSAPEIKPSVKHAGPLHQEAFAAEPIEKTLVAAANYKTQVASMMGDDSNGAPANDESTTAQREIAPTLRTPSVKHVETPAPVVSVVSARPVSFGGPFNGPTSAKKSGPLGTAVMAPAVHLRQFAIPQPPRSSGFSQPPRSSGFSQPPQTLGNLSLVASGGAPGSIFTTLPVPMRRESVAVLPFQPIKHFHPTPSRLRWVLAACVVFLISGVGVALRAAPLSLDVISSSEAKK